MELESARTAAMARQEMLANEPVKSLLWKLSLPAMAGMFTMALYHVVDTIYIGRGVGPAGIAGVTIVFPVMLLLMAVAQMIGIGAASLVSRSLGAGRMSVAERTLGNAAVLSITLGLAASVIMLPNIAFFLRLFGASPTILPFASDYMEVILAGAVVSMYPMAMNNLARAEGNARAAMTNMIFGAVLNIALDPVFIFALHMGVRGAAVATVLSQALTALYITRYFTSGKSTLRLKWDTLKPQWMVVRETVAVGFPSLVRMGSASLIVLIINRTLGLYGGDMSIAAFGIANRAMMFVAMPLMGIAQGLQPILGFSSGARRFDRALDVTKLALLVASAFSLLGFLVLALMPGPIVAIFSTDQVLIDVGAHASQRMFLMFFLVGVQIVGSTVFQTLGMVKKSIVSSTSRQVLFLIPLVLVLPRFFQADGVWLAFPLADALSFILVAAMLVPLLRDFRRRSLDPGVVTGDC